VAAQPGSSKKSTAVFAILVASQILVVILIWIAFSGTDEREGRIRATLAIEKAASIESAIANYYDERKALPADNNALRQMNNQGKPYFSTFEERGDVSYSLNIANGVITLTFLPNQNPVSGKSLIFFPRVSDGKLAWSCDASSIEAGHRPAQCAGQ
jgi:hypothetical protein